MMVEHSSVLSFRGISNSYGSVRESVTGAVCTRAHEDGVAAFASSDGRLGQAVSAALQASNDERLRAVTVSEEYGAVRLCGTLRSYYAKQLALHAAVSVAGCARVRDEIIVEYIRLEHVMVCNDQRN